MEAKEVINIQEVAVEGLQEAVHLFRNVDETMKYWPKPVKLLMKLHANKTLFHALEVVSRLVEMERNKK
jgi:hypothetical protein